MLDRSQETIINQINLFFQLNDRKQHFNEKGYCHGLSLLWLYCMEHNEDEWFYNTITKICCAKTANDFKLFEKDIDKFIYHLEWLQHSSNYEYAMSQTHLEELVQTKVIENLSYLFTHEQINETLTRILGSKHMVAISGYDHTIAMYKRGNRFLLYDPNYVTGKPKEFYSIPESKDAILRSLFTLKERLMTKFPLVFNIFKSQHDQKANINNFFSLHQKIVDSKQDPNEVGFRGITDLILAAENGNATETELLIKRGANPNQIRDNSSTPLFLATVNNHLAVVKMLLQHQANPDAVYTENYTALMCAAYFGLESIVQELLAHHASPVVEDQDHYTAFTMAIVQKQWKVAILLLSHISPSLKLNDFDLYLLKKSLPFLKNELDKNSEGLNLLQQEVCEKWLVEHKESNALRK